jgi:hypothetical protein
MPADGLPDPLLAAKIDLLLGDGQARGGWLDRRGNHRADGFGDPWKVRLRDVRQALLQGQHVVAEQMSERSVQYRPASSIEERTKIRERVARHQELHPVHMCPLVQEFLTE